MKTTEICRECVVGLMLVALLVLVAACSTVPKSPQQAVFDAKAAHAVALRTAVAYRQLPNCSTGRTPCHQPSVVLQLQKADRVADAALDAAENAVRTPGFGENVVRTALATAQESLGAFTAITATLEK